MNTNLSTTLAGRKIDFVKSDSGDFLRSVIVAPAEGVTEIDKIGFKAGTEETRQAKAALRAVRDVLRFGKYNHSETTFGLHILKGADLNQDSTNLGSVSVDYDGEIMQPPALGVYPGNWAQVNRMEGRFYLSGFTPEWAIQRVNKHAWINKIMVNGHGIEIGTTPWSTWKDDNGMSAADYLMATIMEPDDAKAIEMTYAGNSVAQMKHQMGRPMRQVRESERHGVVMPVPTGGIYVTTTSGKLINMIDVPPSQVRVFDASGHMSVEAWTGSFSSQMRFRKVASSNGWTVELL